MTERLPDPSGVTSDPSGRRTSYVINELSQNQFNYDAPEEEVTFGQQSSRSLVSQQDFLDDAPVQMADRPWAEVEEQQRRQAPPPSPPPPPPTRASGLDDDAYDDAYDDDDPMSARGPAVVLTEKAWSDMSKSEKQIPVHVFSNDDNKDQERFHDEDVGNNKDDYKDVVYEDELFKNSQQQMAVRKDDASQYTDYSLDTVEFIQPVFREEEFEDENEDTRSAVGRFFGFRQPARKKKVGDGVFVDEGETDKLETDEQKEYKKRRERFLKMKERSEKKKQELEEQEKEKRKRRRRRCLAYCCCCLCCWLILVILVMIAIWLWPAERKVPAHISDDDEMPTDDWVPFTPYRGIVTTPMDPYVEDDCYFDDNIFPHVVNQCECFGNVTVIPTDVLELWYEIHEDVKEEIYDGRYNESPWSCEPSNMALIWLSSGDVRDRGDLYQRFIMAINFMQMNGTQWDLQNEWLGPENECTWLGVQCNGRFRLNSLALDVNNVHGSLPTELVKLSGLRTLSITRNHLSGTIPIEIVSMPTLEHLILYANQLRGSIPSQIGKASRLKTLLLSNNLLFGRLTTHIGEVTTLEKFSIGFNQFWRNIPTELGLLTNLKLLVMEDNRFSGPLPTELGRLTNLQHLLLSRNLLRGPIPTVFAYMTNLLIFNVAFTGVGGIIPTEFQVLTNLYRLDLGGNNFRGTVMSEFGFMTGLNWLALNNNDLSGTIPTEFGYLANMTRLSFKDTLVHGTIPTELGFMTRLQDLALSQTNLYGTAPDEVCALRLLDLNLFVTDCPGFDDVGVVCAVPDCCTFCRRHGT